MCYRYFVIGNLAESDEEVIRYAGLLRGTESAVQAVSVSSYSFPRTIVTLLTIYHSMACQVYRSWAKSVAST